MFIIVQPNLYAQVIQTGNANAQSSVQTDIQGDGSVTTHIEVNANGDKKVLDANSPGTYSLQIQSNSNNSNANHQTITPTVSLSQEPNSTSASSTIIEKKPGIHKLSFLSNLENNIQNFFHKIFSTFKFK